MAMDELKHKKERRLQINLAPTMDDPWLSSYTTLIQKNVASRFQVDKAMHCIYLSNTS